MNEARRISIYALAGLLLAATAIAAVNLSLPSLQAHTGTLVFSVADAAPSAPNTTVSKIYLTVDQIMIHRENNDTANATGDWTTIPITPAKTIELLSLRNISENFPQLATTKLTAGTYNLISLRIANATATMSGKNQTVIVPSGMLKIPEIRIVISDGGVTNILIDIGYDSIHLNGNSRVLMLRPVAHILSQSHP